MTATILAIGESLVDVVEMESGRVEHPGGSPMNIAFGVARLGLPVTLLTAIGPDARGESIAAHLESAGVAIAPASFRDEPTSSATAHIQQDGSARYVFDIRWSLPGVVSGAESGSAVAVAVPEAVPVADIVHTGSLGAFVDPGGAAVADYLRGVADRSIVTFDPNIRPSVVGSHERAFARFAEIARLATVLKLSDEDAEWLYPGASVDEAIDRILALGPALVAVTRGGDGAVLATTSDRLIVPGVPVDVVDTIGAGDSFMSALIFCLAGLLDAGAGPHALRDGSAFEPGRLNLIGEFAVRCAAVTVSRAGANPPTLVDVAD